MTPGEGAKLLRAMAKDIARTVEATEKRIQKDAVKRAKELSSGPVSEEQLAKIKPGAYSKARPSALFEPSVINKQSGRFRREWKGTARTREGDRIRRRIVNRAPYADFLKYGTSRMHRRPVDKRVEEFIRRRREEMHRKALANYL